ncbi:uncharacterized protein TRUGW13939_01363 [Talaromyces rugulosus]|uniref:Uncharacterized protein n=1 Tax=Talaromyces rugulosus TaxID=121627 RepID=A0A7H8QK15_TALRU|nr:uncharacterized protein TRUGW13939_01363 [Talaromyces rugulosus]QKX54278.1 hypothetical protein TRUGW13939_01363 [Talaromyces rugulosus]
MKRVTSYYGDPSPLSLPLHARLDGSDGQWRALELCLMHHYTTLVCLTMPHSVTANTQMWQQTIPQLSFQSETVLNPMLALSALHRHMYFPKDAFAAKALQRYLDRALVHHHLELSSRNDLSPQLWLSAIMLSHIYWLISHRQHENEVYDIPIQVFKMLEATNRLFASKKEVLKQLGYGWIGNGATPETVLEEWLPVAAQEQLREIKMELTQLLDAFNIIEMQHDERSILMQAKDYVFKCYQAYYSGATVAALRPFVGFMPVNCSSEYLEMLRRHDPLAMALMSRALVLLKELDHVWWLNGFGAFEVVQQDVRGIRHLMPENLRWTMDWPCKVLDGEVVLKV